MTNQNVPDSVTARVKWTTFWSHSLKRLKFTDFVRRTQIINLPLLYETFYASKASFSCCNFSHILNRYDPHRSPPCFGGLFVEERLSSKYKPTSFPGSSLFLPLTKHFPKGVSSYGYEMSAVLKPVIRSNKGLPLETSAFKVFTLANLRYQLS